MEQKSLFVLIFQIKVNRFGDEGCRAICEALKTNTSLKELNIWMIKQKNTFHVSHFEPQGMKLEMKEGEPLLRHSRQTLHSRNLFLN